MTLGLERGCARVVPYDPAWPLRFEELAAQLHALLGDRVLTIEHVGSTSVPGLAAKPILDVLVGVPDFAATRTFASELATLGFEFRPQEEIPDRHYFRRFTGGLRTHHLSLAELDSEHYRNTIAFRDALRGDPVLARTYESLKLALARRFPFDRESYQNGKTDFVLAVLKARGL